MKEKIKGFLEENVDSIVFAGQLLLVAVVCISGIKGDLNPQEKKGKKRRHEKKR